MIRRKKKIQKETMLAEGIRLSGQFYEQKENRLLTLFLKAVIVYFLVMGSLGGMLSAFEIHCNMVVLHIIILLAAWYCVCLYYRKKWENIGYVLLLFLMLAFGIPLHRYINSGFYGVVNDIAQQATSFFGSNAVRSYQEQVANRSLAITISMSYIGVICCIVTNILVSRKMRYVPVTILSIGSLLLPIYFDKEPSVVYMVFLITGLTVTFLMRGNGHYKLRTEDSSYYYEEEKRRITYQYDRRSFAGILCLVFAFSVVGTAMWALLCPKEEFKSVHTMSSWKAGTLDTMENIYLLGLAGIMNFYPNTGGLTSGELGRVNSVRFDYNPDLTIEFVPYTYDRIYLKTFTGANYYPYDNQWSRGIELEQKEAKSTDTVQRLQKHYEAGEVGFAKGKMNITNEEAAIGVYLPYYSGDTDQKIMPGETKSYTYYPMLTEKLEDDAEGLNSKAWLTIPEENKGVIADICRKAGFSGKKEKIEAELKQYFQENYPYTLKPGATPREADFVNYFLTQNKRGYCAHYASAAVLIYRYMGIPARYVEGYAIDAEEIAEDGEVLADKQASEYYDGTAEIEGSGVVSFEVTDANAHAWVEIYDEKTGWKVSEVTPYSTEQETTGGLWSMFMQLFGGGNASDSEKQSGGKETDTVTGRISKISVKVVQTGCVVFLLLFAAYFVMREGKKVYHYRNGNRSEKLIIRYRHYIRKVSRRKKGLKKQKNYEEQIAYLMEKGMLNLSKEDATECVRILNKAGFSEEELTETEFCRIKKLGL